MRALLAPLVVGVVIGVVGCASIEVSTDYDPAASFSGWKTYTWSDRGPIVPQDPRYDNELMRDRVQRALEKGLRERGFQRADGAGDFSVTWHFVVDRKTYRSSDVHLHRFGATYTVSSPALAAEFDEGILIVDLFDGATDKLAWRGTASGLLRGKRDPEAQQKRIDDTVRAVLERFPPK